MGLLLGVDRNYRRGFLTNIPGKRRAPQSPGLAVTFKDTMLPGEPRSQAAAIWNACWSGGISNPMEALEQITCVLFIRRLTRTRWRRNSFLRVSAGAHISCASQ